MYEKSTVYIVGHGKTSSENAITSNFKIFFIGLVIDTTDDLVVDMECSAVAAVAQFREKEVFQFFYAADNLDADRWDMRSLDNRDKLDEKDKAALLAMELAVKIEDR